MPYAASSGMRADQTFGCRAIGFCRHRPGFFSEMALLSSLNLVRGCDRVPSMIISVSFVRGVVVTVIFSEGKEEERRGGGENV